MPRVHLSAALAAALGRPATRAEEALAARGGGGDGSVEWLPFRDAVVGRLRAAEPGRRARRLFAAHDAEGTGRLGRAAALAALADFLGTSTRRGVSAAARAEIEELRVSAARDPAGAARGEVAVTAAAFARIAEAELELAGLGGGGGAPGG